LIFFVTGCGQYALESSELDGDENEKTSQKEAIPEGEQEGGQGEEKSQESVFNEDDSFEYSWDLSQEETFDFDDQFYSFGDDGISFVNQSFVDQTSSEGEFGGGAAEGVDYLSDELTLSEEGLLAGSGTFASRVFDAGAQVSWDQFTATLPFPVQKELPGNGAIESDFTNYNVDMSFNEFLFRFNEEPYVGLVDDEVQDSSGCENHGKVYGNVTTVSDGRFASASYFDGIKDYIKVEDAGNMLNGVDELTVSSWVKSETTVTNAGFISGDTPTHFEKTLGLRYDYQYKIGLTKYFKTIRGSIAVDIGGGTIKTLFYNSAEEQQSTDWQHIVLVWKSGEQLKLYINGVEDTPVANSAAVSGEVANIGDLHIGKGPSNWSKYGWFGNVDELAVFAKALDQDEIYSIYQRGATNVKAQVRSCEQSDCSDQSFSGPYLDQSAFFDVDDVSFDENTISFPLTGFDSSRYFQYQLTFETTDPGVSAVVSEVEVDFTFAGDFLEPITVKNGVSFKEIQSFEDSFEEGSASDLGYQISKDGENWYYYNGAKWASASNTPYETNPAYVVNAFVDKFDDEVGSGDFYFRAYFLLSSEGGYAKLNSVKVTGTEK